MVPGRVLGKRHGKIHRDRPDEAGRTIGAIIAWLEGLILGVVADLVLPYTFALYGVPVLLAIALAVTATFLRPRPSGLAGFLIVVGADWLLALKGATDQCAETNRLPNTSCQMGDNSLLMLLGWLLLVAGVALTGLSLRRGASADRAD